MSALFSPDQLIPAGTVRWQSPSNIAIIKYWGKHGLQLPNNPSFSLTLSVAHTRTALKYQLQPADHERQITVSLNGEPQPGFAPKIGQFFDRIAPEYPFVKSMSCHIETYNSFPHSSGIASSASAMSALALCIAEITERTEDFFEISRISRLGSGSASRSVFPHGSVWGYSDDVFGSSDTYAIGVSDLMHPVFKSFRDSILIVKSGKKSVSSSAGHDLMKQHPYAEQRYAQARERLPILMKALNEGDLETFGEICEQEALELHALMMCSTPPYLLMESHTVELIRRIQAFRSETGLHTYFTLDAGPNIHLLYPAHEAEQVVPWVNSELLEFCENRHWIDDHVGEGPQIQNQAI